MSEPKVIEDADQAILHYLGEGEDARCFARLLATGVAGIIETWADAEEERGTPMPLVNSAIVALTSTLIGSFIAQGMRPSGDAEIVPLTVQLFSVALAGHVSACRDHYAAEAERASERAYAEAYPAGLPSYVQGRS